jgi:hypothetical protein
MNEQQECCDTPRGFVGGTCDYCEGVVQPETPEPVLTGDLTRAIGKTISLIKEGDNNGYAAVFITFTDGDTLTLEGGGYDGYGDYIRVA